MRDVKREESEHAFGDQFNFHFPAHRSRYCPGHTKRAAVAIGMIMIAIVPRFMLLAHFDAITSPQKRDKLDSAKLPVSAENS